MSIEIAIAPSPQAIEIEIGGASSGGLVPIASETVLGGVKVGANLKIDAGGVLSVDTATEVQEDNTRPVTSAAVFMELGNVEALLAAL